MKAYVNKLLIISSVLVISACSIQAPPYKASIENVQLMKTANVSEIKIDAITSDKPINTISLRGTKMSSPVGQSYGEYFSKALEEELKLAKLWSPVSATVVSGQLLTNDIDITGFSEGKGVISAKFTVLKNNELVFEQVVSAEHTFESSFVGAIAIPNGQQSYVDLTQKLIKNLFENKAFIAAIKS